MKEPLVSIIIPAFNQSKYIDYTLNSVQNQIYTNWECIIVDDNSTDDTKFIVENWVKKDSRFKYFHKENGGVASARNYGFSKSKGEYIQFLDSDDYITIDRIHNCIRVMEKNKEIDLTITNFKMFVDNIDNSHEPFCDLTNYNFDFKTVLLKWDRGVSFPLHTVFLRKKSIESVKFNEETRYKEDWIYWINVLKDKKEVYFLNEFLSYYRINPNGKHKKSNENFVKVCNLIFNELEVENRADFFNRMTEEVIELKEKLVACSIAYDQKALEVTKLKMNIFKKLLNKFRKLF